MTVQIKTAPKQYWEDSKWANKNFTNIVRQYPDKYVAVYKKKIVASGKTIAKVEEIAYKKTGIKELPIKFAEKKIHVY